MMKIAIPSSNNNVDDHFGHCEYFTIITADEKKQIVGEEIVRSSQGCGCKSNIAETLKKKGVTVMLAGNIGGGAIDVLSRHDIEVVRGCSGNVKAVVQQWLNGAAMDSGEVCHQHEHECRN
jgi:predicted Fe-Mo cluster-binding NifX family protein